MTRLQEILRGSVNERRCRNFRNHTKDKPGCGGDSCWCGAPMELVPEHLRINIALSLQQAAEEKRRPSADHNIAAINNLLF